VLRASGQPTLRSALKVAEVLELPEVPLACRQ
jgi:hypothetical protein